MRISPVSNNLCNDPYDELNYNPYQEKRSLSFQLNSHKAGRTVVNFELCLPNQEDACVSKTFSIDILPGSIDKNGLSLFIGSQRILDGATTPVMVDAVDHYGNNV
ncbi:MAG: hypothetical protein GXP45_04800 [bacterium]|nr:hypothetical protein [bacterium]